MSFPFQVLCKISNQAAMRESLAKEKREAESRAATLRQEWESLGNQFRDLKVDGYHCCRISILGYKTQH